LARSAHCMWGDEHIDFNYLLHAIRATFRTDEGCPLWVVLHRRSFTVANILSSTRGLQCADERDRVFATLGLPYDKRFTTDLVARIRQIQPNYALPVSQTMIEYARAFIECSYTNLLLAQVCHGSTINSDTNTPSWLPNLGTPSPGQFVPLGTGLLIANKSIPDCYTSKDGKGQTQSAQLGHLWIQKQRDQDLRTVPPFGNSTSTHTARVWTRHCIGYTKGFSRKCLCVKTGMRCSPFPGKAYTLP